MRQIGQQTRRSYGRKVAALRYLPSGLMLQLEAPYDRPFTDTLKKSIQTKKRIWDGNDKCWYIAKGQFDRVCHLLDQYYDETIFTLTFLHKKYQTPRGLNSIFFLVLRWKL